jgi:hypothetical protein
MFNRMLQVGRARVTPRGIRLNNIYYSCSLAIHEQWYEKAYTHGNWKVKAQYNPEDSSKIYIMVEEQILQCDCIIIESFQGSKLERYFNIIQKLKRQRSILKKQRQRRGDFYA